MIRLSGYYIAPEEIEAIEAVASNRPDYPYRLAVTLKSGRGYSVDYRDEQRRNEVADSIVRAVDFARDREAPPTMQTIRWAVQAEAVPAPDREGHEGSRRGAGQLRKEDTMEQSTTRETRRASYEAILPKGAARRQLILETLGSRRMTASEITEELLKAGKIKYFNRNFVAPRLTELKKSGVIEVVGRRRATRSDATEAVWARKE